MFLKISSCFFAENAPSTSISDIKPSLDLIISLNSFWSSSSLTLMLLKTISSSLFFKLFDSSIASKYLAI